MSLLTISAARAQFEPEREILELSLDKFRWKTEGLIERIEDLFDDHLVFIHITGDVTTKAEWIGQLGSGRFLYERIEPTEASAKVYGDAAVLVGPATFIVSIGGRRATYRLIYTEVYARKSGAWRLVNLHTTSD
jgi:hypothetical protein